MKNYKHIHLGKLILQRVREKNMDSDKICSVMKCTEKELSVMYESKSLDTEVILRLSKLLEYDFFRIYSQHLIIYSPRAAQSISNPETEKSSLPQFRKNIYTKEIISFILDSIAKGKITKNQVIEQYGIPKTTLYKWLKEKHKY